MAVLSKTDGITLLALQSVASNTVVLGTAVDVSSKFAASIGIHFGRRIATALTAVANFRLEVSMKSSEDGQWFTIPLPSSDFAAVTAQAVSGTVSSGTNVITVAATAGFVAGTLIYIDNSEWGRVKSIVLNTSITIEDNLVNAQTGSTIYSGANIFNLVQVDLAAVKRIRLVADCSGTGQATAVEAFMFTGDSIA
ncbi:MAG: hypothetical protein JWN86_427 [Planctomycetota bacterium]|nr:hypothetical protein [Planctomycetota bacterium]